MNKIDLVRFTPIDRPTDTLGLFFIDGQFRAFSLEDAYHETKIPKRTRIPAGTYDVILTHSDKFGRDMPLIHKVPGYDGIRIHGGLNAAHTDGCLLVAYTATFWKDKESVLANSTIAADAIEAEIVAALRAGDKIKIEVRDVDLDGLINISTKPITVS